MELAFHHAMATGGLARRETGWSIRHSICGGSWEFYLSEAHWKGVVTLGNHIWIQAALGQGVPGTGVALSPSLQALLL